MMWWLALALVLALNVGFVLGAWWASRPRLHEGDEEALRRGEILTTGEAERLRKAGKL